MNKPWLVLSLFSFVRMMTAFSTIMILISRPAFAAETSPNDAIRVAYFSKDVPAIDPLHPSFDPDSYAVITQIFDSLIHIDLDGKLTPALANSWKMLSPTKWEFKLRQGVKFHNGEDFDGNAVKFTYEYVMNKENSAGNAWILNTIKSVTVDESNKHRIIIETAFPDGMFLYRFSMFGSICPPKYIREVGIAKFHTHPIGTGPFKFVSWNQGKEIRLAKNESYWQKGLPKAPAVSFVMLPESQWKNALVDGTIDFVPNLSGRETSKLTEASGGKVRIIKRLILSDYWVLLKNSGPLASKEVRQALNYALNKEDIIKYGDYGNAKPAASIGKEGEFGYNETLKPYPFDPEKAKEILSRVNGKLKLKMLVADIAEKVGRVIAENLTAVGVEVEIEIASRPVWAEKVIGYKIKNGKSPDYDIVVNLVDNPIVNLAFHAGLFLASPSPWSLLNDEAYDKKFLHALQTSDPVDHEKRLKLLDKYIHDEALMLFTSQRIITAGIGNSVGGIEKFGINGHLDYNILTKAFKIKK
ncbi:MAG TPA: ABC transporter substrate-binding protein [Oligoflexus sp.]|uniref:ABC transporter substrate-binding protein n=1 Tax=Oligoflexus sp. TaxID=1971216 RepID=UPI002D64FD7F|nr:ABC transporter substrate-binding protein [Oligoflexus sp.]HYX33981.1 ABC transporter substrate-binding protein [Oligoflexus sp.]